MTNNQKRLTAALAFLVAILPTQLPAAESFLVYGYAPTEDEHIGEKEYSPYLNIGYPQRVYWGDTHLHTSLSTDAGMIGNRLGPEEAYRFARGEMVVSSTGVRARLRWIARIVVNGAPTSPSRRAEPFRH